MSPKEHPVRLACVRHAASVRPEPGSNSQKIVSQAFRLKIKFLNNLLLAILLKNFRWLKFDFSKLKQSFHQLSKVFLVRLSRYSIYKVQAVRFSLSLAANFYMLPHLQAFVKNFFQVFENSF